MYCLLSSRMHLAVIMSLPLLLRYIMLRLITNQTLKVHCYGVTSYYNIFRIQKTFATRLYFHFLLQQLLLFKAFSCLAKPQHYISTAMHIYIYTALTIEPYRFCKTSSNIYSREYSLREEPCWSDLATTHNAKQCGCITCTMCHAIHFYYIESKRNMLTMRLYDGLVHYKEQMFQLFCVVFKRLHLYNKHKNKKDANLITMTILIFFSYELHEHFAFIYSKAYEEEKIVYHIEDIYRRLCNFSPIQRNIYY